MNLIPGGNSSICVKIGTKLFFLNIFAESKYSGFRAQSLFCRQKRNGVVSFLQSMFTI